MLAEPANVSQHLLPLGAIWRNSLGVSYKVNLDHKEDWAIHTRVRWCRTVLVSDN